MDFLLDSIHIFHKYNLLCCYKELSWYCQVGIRLQDHHESSNFLHHTRIDDRNNLERIRKYHTYMFHGPNIGEHFRCNPGLRRIRKKLNMIPFLSLNLTISFWDYLNKFRITTYRVSWLFTITLAHHFQIHQNLFIDSNWIYLKSLLPFPRVFWAFYNFDFG